MQKRTLSQMYGNKIASGGNAKKRTLAEMYGNNTGGLNVSTKPTGTQTVKKEEPKDNGGFFGGLGYLGEKLAVGLVSSLEGALDYVGSGFAKLIGDDKWAEEIISEDWFGDWYSHPEQWFNPSDGWKVAGDVAGGIGTSIPGIATAVGLTVATGGLAAPAAVKIGITGVGSGLASGLGAAGRSTKEAYEETGVLSEKEFGYGALSGLTEGSLEGVTNVLSLGGGAVVKSISKAFGKEIGEAAVKEGVIKTLGKSFIGEAFEESMSEILDPFWKRATYDADAEGASLDQILYSGLVGGLSGMVMGGGGMAISATASTVKGNKLANNGGYAEVLDTSNNLIQKIKRDGLDEDIFKEISETREKLITSMLQTDNKIVNLQQKKMLGELATANVRATGNMFVAKRALNIVNNAEVIAERMSAFGYKDANGRAMSFTAEELTAGYDPKKPSSIYKALRDNSVLRTVAVADAAGALMIDTRKFTEATLTGKKLASQVDINRFVKSATSEEIKAVSDALKIDDWRTLTRDTLAEKITEYLNEGGLQRNLQEKELRAEFEAATPLEGYTIPKTFLFKKDGVRRFSDGSGDIGISKSGDVYRIFDYDTRAMTKEMSRAEVNTVLRDYDGKRFAAFESERRRLAEIEAMQKENAEIEELVRTNVKDYAKLSAPAQSQIERIVREGRAKGVSDSDVLMYAKVAAHSGLDFAFDKESNAIRNSEFEIRNDTSSTVKDGPPSPQGEGLRYADGYYDASRNLIVINPEATRTAERLLIHELDHAIRKSLGKNGATRIYFEAIKNVDQATRDKITKAYKKTAKHGEAAATIMDETNAYYAEQVLGNKYTLEKLVEAEPSLKEKILNFFKGAAADYADVPKLSGAAKRYYRTYKKLFDEFSARNSEAFVNEKSLMSMNQENMQVSDRQYALDSEAADRDYSSAVERGDMETAQRIVDEAAEKWSNGNALMTMDVETGEAIFKFYRSSDGGRTFWDGHGNNQAKGVFLTTNKYVARAFDPDGKYITVFAKANNPFEIDAKGQIYTGIPVDENSAPAWLYNMSSSATEWNDRENDYVTVDYVDIDNLYPEAFKQGYDAVIVKNVKEGVGGNLATDIVLKDGGTQMKSADPVTYDDNGRVIPLSERFNERNPDIRYALPLDEDGISGAEVLSWFENRSKGDGKIDLEATVARGLPYKRGKSDLTVGEIRKVIANTTHEKVYSKKDALRVVNKFSGSSGLTVKAREEIADTIWQFLNEAPDVEYRADMAQDIAEFIVAKILVDSKTENPDAIAAAETLSYLRTGIGKISFTDGDITELHHAVDDKGVKRLVGRWGYKGAHKVAGGEMVRSRRVPMDVYVTEIARNMPGMEHLKEMHPMEAFLEIDRAYERAYADSKDKWISSYWDMPDSEIPSMIAGVRDAILEAYNNEGEKSKFTKLMDEKISRYQKRAEYYKAERDEIRGRDKILGLLMNQASKMKDLKMGTYANATQHDSDVLRSSVERLSRIQFRGNLNVSGTRDIIKELGLWYTTSNSMLGYAGEKDPGYYVQGIADMLKALSEGEGGFSKSDLTMLYDVMSYFTNFVETYRKVYRKGQWVDADVEAKRYVDILQTNSKLKVGVVRRLLGSSYMQTFGDPMTVARQMDMYENGFFTEMMEELREGALGAQVAESEIMADYDAFLNKNRKYIEKTASEEVFYHGDKIPKMQLIGLYMTLKRKHARAGLAENGFYFENLKGERVRVNGFALDVKDITEAEIDKRAEEQLGIIGRLLSDTDKEYIKILEKAYNVDARKLKADRDMQRLGFTNAGLGYYYPIRRGNIEKNVDSSEYMAEMDRVTNSSFNKNTVRGARQELYIENADAVFRRHVRAVCQYAYLAPAIESYNMLYNADVGGNPNHPISVATESENTWKKGNSYFKKLISDIQGIPAVSGEGKELLSKIRGGYAKFQLGANPKVWFTQGSSIFASTSLLDADSIIKGATVSAEGIDKYCPLAKLRNSENTAAIAQAVIDTRGKKIASGVDRISDALMIPIGKVDRFVVSRLFGACQVQVEKDGGGKVGTEENKIAAGKLLEKVIFETQQNSIATERSAAMRSGSEFMKGITMFTSDSMKVMGRVIDGFGEVLTLKERVKQERDASTKELLEKRLKAAEKKTKKALGAMATSAIYMAAVAQLFRWLFAKEEEEDETTFGIVAADVAGNLIGGLPLVKDVISRIFLGGYELENNAYAAINDIIDSAATLKTVSEKWFDGELEAEERNRAIRSMAYSVGQLTGLPFRNVYNTFYGLTKRFLPLTAFKIDSVFYKKNYQTELNKAVESGDNEKASFILNLMLGERVEGNVPQIVFDEMLNLTQSGYKAVPRVMPSKITVGGEEYTLSETERDAMKKIYSGAEGALEKLFSNQSYKDLDPETKAKLIDHVYDTYYAEASSFVLGTNGGNRVVAAKAVGADALALLYAKTKDIESDKDREGKTIAGSKRAKVVKAIGELGVSAEERLLLVCASGYSLKDGDIRGVSAERAKTRLLKYILNLKGVSAAEKAEIAEMCGFEVKNGRIVRNSAGLPKLKV